jgi:ABC-type uncharacterized transport system ATPase subunit
VVKKYASHKVIEVILEDGTVKTFQAKRGKVAEKAQQLLKDLPVSDLTIKEPEIEDVIRDVFQNA